MFYRINTKSKDVLFLFLASVVFTLGLVNATLAAPSKTATTQVPFRFTGDMDQRTLETELGVPSGRHISDVFSFTAGLFGSMTWDGQYAPDLYIWRGAWHTYANPTKTQKWWSTGPHELDANGKNQYLLTSGKVKMGAYVKESGGWGHTDSSLELYHARVVWTFRYPILSVNKTTVDFANLYIHDGDYGGDAYNKGKTQNIILSNSGDDHTELEFTVDTTDGEINIVGTPTHKLKKGESKTISLWLSPNAANQNYSKTLTITAKTATSGTVIDPVTITLKAKVIDHSPRPSQLPESKTIHTGVNDKFSVQVKVGSPPTFPNTTWTDYQWQQTNASSPNHSSWRTIDGTTTTYVSNPQGSPGSTYVYARVLDSNRVASQSLKVNVRVWEPPTVDKIEAPFTGIKGQEMSLQASGKIGESGQTIAKYHWYGSLAGRLNNYTEDAPLVQIAGTDVVFIPQSKTSQAGNNISCRAVSSQGIVGPVQTLTYKVYEPVSPKIIGSPYSGRTNGDIELKGFVNQLSYLDSKRIAYRWMVSVGSGTGKEDLRVYNGKQWKVPTDTELDENTADYQALFLEGAEVVEHKWTQDGNYRVFLDVLVLVKESIPMYGSSDTTVQVESGIPTARPEEGGPYRGGIAGGWESPVSFQGNRPGQSEGDDVGHIVEWAWDFVESGNRLSRSLTFNDVDHAVQTDVIDKHIETISFWVKHNVNSTQQSDALPNGDWGGAIVNIPLGNQDLSFGLSTLAGKLQSWGDTSPTLVEMDRLMQLDGGLTFYYGAPDYSLLNTLLLFEQAGMQFYLNGVLLDREFFVTGDAQKAILKQGVWYHCVVTGIFEVPDFASSSPLFMGAMPGVHHLDTRALKCSLDDVAIFDRTLSQAEIRDLMSDGISRSLEGVIGHWPFDEGQGATTADTRFKTTGETAYPATLGIVKQNGLFEAFDEATDGNELYDMWQSSGSNDNFGNSPSVLNVYNPRFAYSTAGDHIVSLQVKASGGKWSPRKSTTVNIVAGKIAGTVKAADLRTPVKKVILTLTSSHVDKSVLSDYVAAKDDSLMSNEWGVIYTETDDEGQYVFDNLPLGSYRIRASKTEAGLAHEFEKEILTVNVSLDAPIQLANDFVDLSVFPIGGRVHYSIKRVGKTVSIKDVVVTAQAIGKSNSIEALPTTKSADAKGQQYSMPLFAGKYLFSAKMSSRDYDIRLIGTHPTETQTLSGYDSDSQLVTIKGARTDIDFIDYTQRTIDVYVEDSGGFPIVSYENKKIEVLVDGNNGYEKKEVVIDENGRSYIQAQVPPGTYTVSLDEVPKAVVKDKPGITHATVDVTGGNGTVTMVVPVKIELTITSEAPRLLQTATVNILTKLGLEGIEAHNPERFMVYWPAELQTYTYTLSATANGQPVTKFTLYVTDEISQVSVDAPEEKVISATGTTNEISVPVIAGLPKMDVESKKAQKKFIRFRATKNNYEEGETEDYVYVIGELPVGTAQRLISVPEVNHFVLHDPPGDQSYSYLNDSMTLKGIVTNMKLTARDGSTMTVYPSPWTGQRAGLTKSLTADGKQALLDDKYATQTSADTKFVTLSAAEMGRSAAMAALAGPAGYAVQIANMAASWGIMDSEMGIQYSISPSREIKTGSGESIPDLVGPGKGDVYYGEGWTLGLQQKYLLGIEQSSNGEWVPKTATERWTYDILNRTNQYLYTVRDIEGIIKDLDLASKDSTTIESEDDSTDSAQRSKIQDAKTHWTNLLDRNLAYKWHKYYAGTKAKVEKLKERVSANQANQDEITLLNELAPYYDMITAEGGEFEAFLKNDGAALAPESAKKSANFETFIFSAGPSFEYSRKISEGEAFTVSVDAGAGASGSLGTSLHGSTGWKWFGTGVTLDFNTGAEGSVDTSTSMSKALESGEEIEQSVGFVLQDDDVGDNITTRIYEDPVWGTPLFFADSGSITSDPWQPGTQKAVDFKLELVEGGGDNGPFDYHKGAHYRVKVSYTGIRELESSAIDSVIYDYPTLNQGGMTVKFNGSRDPYVLYLSKTDPSVIVEVSLYPPAIDQNNTEEKEYEVGIEVDSIEDPFQIYRVLTLKPRFADLTAPRAIISSPYNGQRISPKLFPQDDPFEIKVFSDDIDLAQITLQYRFKRQDGVWETWKNIVGLFENDQLKTNIKLVSRSPQRKEFTYKWTTDETEEITLLDDLGLGEYALRAVASDKATRLPENSNEDTTQKLQPNYDLDPPVVIFSVDGDKPTVLTSKPFYQNPVSDRIYREELSVTFNDDMRIDDFSDRTFVVTDLLEGDGSTIPGFVSYSPTLRKATFVPVVPFRSNGFYRVNIKTDTLNESGEVEENGVHDSAGNPLDDEFSFTFYTKDSPFEETWNLAFSVSDGSSTDSNNIAAVAYKAKDTEDGLDARAVPRLGSQIAFSFLLNASGNAENAKTISDAISYRKNPIELDRDIRPADSRLSHHW